MSAEIERAAARAHMLVQTGDVAAAQATLQEALGSVEPDPTRASGSLATAAMLYAQVLVALGEAGNARRWAAYAHIACKLLYGAGDERTLQAASVLATVLHRAGAHRGAAHIYRELIDQLSAAEGPQSSQVLAARADLATVLHTRGGNCPHARALLAKTWSAYRKLYGEGNPLGIKMVARLAAMERDCGLAERARERFALAEALCREHLPRGHRLAEQILALAQAPPDHHHTCCGVGRPA